MNSYSLFWKIIWHYLLKLILHILLDVYYCIAKYNETNKNNKPKSILIVDLQRFAPCVVEWEKKTGEKVGMIWSNICKIIFVCLLIFLGIICNGRFEYSWRYIFYLIIWTWKKYGKIFSRLLTLDIASWADGKEKERMVAKAILYLKKPTNTSKHRGINMEEFSGEGRCLMEAEWER